MGALDYIVWTPRRGEDGEDRYLLPPTNPEYHPDIPLDQLHQIPIMAGELPPEISQQTGPRFWDDPVTGYTIEQVNKCSDWNQIMAEMKRRGRNLQLSSDGGVSDFLPRLPFARSVASGMMMQEEAGMPVGMFPYEVGAYGMSNSQYIQQALSPGMDVADLLSYEDITDPGGAVSGLVVGLIGWPMPRMVLYNLRKRLSAVNKHTLAMTFDSPNDRIWISRYFWDGSKWVFDSEVVQHGSPWHVSAYSRVGVEARIPEGSEYPPNPPYADPAVLYRMRQLYSVALPPALAKDIPNISHITAAAFSQRVGMPLGEVIGNFTWRIGSYPPPPRVRLYMSDSDDSEPELGDQNNTDNLLVEIESGTFPYWPMGGPFPAFLDYKLTGAALTAFKNRLALMLADPTIKMSFVLTTEEEENLESLGFPTEPPGNFRRVDNFFLDNMYPNDVKLTAGIHIFTDDGDPAP